MKPQSRAICLLFPYGKAAVLRGWGLSFFSFCLLCLSPSILLSRQLEPDSVESGLQELRELGLHRGEYGIYNELETLRDDGVPATDPRWQLATLRFSAVTMAEPVAEVRKSDSRPAGHRRKLAPETRVEILQEICDRLGSNHEALSKAVGKMSRSNPEGSDAEWSPLLNQLGEAVNQQASTRIRLAAANTEAMRLALEDLAETFPERSPEAHELIRRLPQIESQLNHARKAILNNKPDGEEAARKVFAFQNAIAQLNPLLQSEGILLVKRSINTPIPAWKEYAASTVVRTHPADNEIAILEAPKPDASLRTLYRPEDLRFVGHVDLDWEAEHILFTEEGHLREMALDQSSPQPVIQGEPDWLDSFDACYLPDGNVIFASTAGSKGVPCENGKNPTQTLFRLERESGDIRRLTFDQDHCWHPTVLNDGRILYTRWDYTDAHHYYARLLCAMYPDGTAQFSIYGSNAYFPNGKLQTRPIPWQSGKLITVESGHVEPIGRAGRLLLLDLDRADSGPEGVMQVVPEPDAPIRTTLNYVPVRDFSAPRYRNPWPLADASDPRGSGRYFLTSCKLHAAGGYGIYLTDIFGNLILLKEEPGYDLLEPIPLRPRFKPPILPSRLQPEQDMATIHLIDVYTGDGLKDVPRGSVKALRLYSYHFGYEGIGGHLAIGINSGWDARRILGTVPVEADGSAFFEVPANTPIAVQPLDEDGAALQIMRSWYTAMPGENGSCIGCHEDLNQTPPTGAGLMALERGVSQIDPWYGPSRPFSFQKEVQPVLDRHCVSCHNGEGAQQNPGLFDLRKKELNTEVPDRVHEFPTWQNAEGTFSASYRILQRYVRRPMLESDYILRNPGEYHANTSPLIQLLRKGHYGVSLTPEDWDRLITWIDLNAPYFGTWTDVNEAREDPERFADQLALQIQERQETGRNYGGPPFDPEAYPADVPQPDRQPVKPAPVSRPEAIEIAGWPWDSTQTNAVQNTAHQQPRFLEADGIRIELRALPEGRFVMGDRHGAPDEWPEHVAEVGPGIWMATREITNAEYALFDPKHESGFHDNTGKNNEGRGRPLNRPEQPVVRVSWEEANAFCQWLSEKSSLRVRLPTETEWEFACRAGADTAMHYGSADDDFSPYENFADQSLHDQNFFFPLQTYPDRINALRHYLTPFAIDNRFADGFTLPAAPGSLAPNALGFYDMHGNVQEWTASPYQAYGNASEKPVSADKVARGGSWCDRPSDARASIRRPFPSWQRVHNVGFRVVVDAPPAPATSAENMD